MLFGLIDRGLHWSNPIETGDKQPYLRCYDKNGELVGYVRQHNSVGHPDPLFKATIASVVSDGQKAIINEEVVGVYKSVSYAQTALVRKVG